MKKNLLHRAVFSSLLFLAVTTANAQLGIIKKPGLALGANFIYSMPQGNFNDAYKFGVGGEIYAGIKWGSTALIGSVGATAYKNRSGFSNTLTSVPVKVGLKKYFLLRRIFLNADLGVTTVKVGGVSSSGFTAGFGAGVRLLGLELSLYQNTFKNNGAYSSSDYSNSLNAKIGFAL